MFSLKGKERIFKKTLKLFQRVNYFSWKKIRKKPQFFEKIKKKHSPTVRNIVDDNNRHEELIPICVFLQNVVGLREFFFYPQIFCFFRPHFRTISTSFRDDEPSGQTNLIFLVLILVGTQVSLSELSGPTHFAIL